MENQESQETKKFEEVVFWSRAKSCRLANFKEEKRDGRGRIERPESPIRFYNHIFVARTPEESAFIRNHNGYESGDVKECPGGTAEANKMTAQHDAVKYGVSDERAEFVESTVITEGR